MIDIWQIPKYTSDHCTTMKLSIKDFFSKCDPVTEEILKEKNWILVQWILALVGQTLHKPYILNLKPVISGQSWNLIAKKPIFIIKLIFRENIKELGGLNYKHNLPSIEFPSHYKNNRLLCFL